ncbi:MAG: HEAT repeat domain-containing protein [Halobacteriales archaeon]
MAVIDPTIELVLWVGITILSLLVAVGAITITASIYYRLGDRRREAVRSDVRYGILERMSSDEPDWEGWVADLSEVESEVARTELDTYLRSTEGEEHDRLRECGDALGIPSDAREMLATEKRHRKLQALSWLALLEEAPDPATLRETCTADSDLRAAGARVLHEADHPAARSVGTELLLGNGDLTLSVYGLDTLYQLHRATPAPLFERAATEYPDWRPSLIIQILTVLRHCGVAGRDAPREWIVELTDHDLPAVRAAAVTALEPGGWRTDLRETVDIDRLVEDSDATTRRAVYAMLAEWDDEPALEALADAAVTDPDQRARVRALEPLVDRPELASPGAAGAGDDRYERAWAWARANAVPETDS